MGGGEKRGWEGSSSLSSRMIKFLSCLVFSQKLDLQESEDGGVIQSLDRTRTGKSISIALAFALRAWHLRHGSSS